MPYIKGDDRVEIDEVIDELAFSIREGPGRLNYAITRLLLVLYHDRKTYSAYNEIVGVLECVKQEFYRRAVAPYEDQKAKENGDVY